MPSKPIYGKKYEYHPEEIDGSDEDVGGDTIEDSPETEISDFEDELDKELAHHQELFDTRKAKDEKKKRIRETKR